MKPIIKLINIKSTKHIANKSQIILNKPQAQQTFWPHMPDQPKLKRCRSPPLGPSACTRNSPKSPERVCPRPQRLSRSQAKRNVKNFQTPLVTSRIVLFSISFSIILIVGFLKGRCLRSRFGIFRKLLAPGPSYILHQRLQLRPGFGTGHWKAKEIQTTPLCLRETGRII